ncbi:MAG: hypothetical protein ACE5H3_08560, partial [Planctomycetota bacterium]
MDRDTKRLLEFHGIETGGIAKNPVGRVFEIEPEFLLPAVPLPVQPDSQRTLIGFSIRLPGFEREPSEFRKIDIELRRAPADLEVKGRLILGRIPEAGILIDEEPSAVIPGRYGVGPAAEIRGADLPRSPGSRPFQDQTGIEFKTRPDPLRPTPAKLFGNTEETNLERTPSRGFGNEGGFVFGDLRAKPSAFRLEFPGFVPRQIQGNEKSILILPVFLLPQKKKCPGFCRKRSEASWLETAQQKGV